MKKIVYFIDSLQIGGAERSIFEIAKRINAFEVIVVILFSDRDDLRGDFESARIKIIDLNLQRSDRFWFWNGKKQFEKICKELNPHIIHAHLYKCELIARIADLPKSSILLGAFVNDSYSKERYLDQSFIRNCKLNIIKFIERITINKNNYITSITNAIKVTNCNSIGYPLEKTVVINRGREINTNLVHYQYDQKLFKFLAVGRLLKRKGYFELIDALEILNKLYSNISLDIAGSGVDENEIKAYASGKGIQNINFLGHRNDVQTLLANNHCFVFASHYEGQGGALVEAMLSGIPIITSDIDVFKEQVEDDLSAKFFKVKNAEDLADKMNWVRSNYDQAVLLGMNAKRKAKECFDIENIAKQTQDFYLSILK